VTANYWDYPTASNSIPTAVFNGVTSSPADVTNDAGLSACLTQGQGGNVFEWMESASDGLNNLSSENRAIRGGFWLEFEFLLRSSNRSSGFPTNSLTSVGFRVASVAPVPEPVTAVIGIGLLWIGVCRRRRGPSL